MDHGPSEVYGEVLGSLSWVSGLMDHGPFEVYGEVLGPLSWVPGLMDQGPSEVYGEVLGSLSWVPGLMDHGPFEVFWEVHLNSPSSAGPGNQPVSVAATCTTLGFPNGLRLSQLPGVSNNPYWGPNTQSVRNTATVSRFPWLLECLDTAESLFT